MVFDEATEEGGVSTTRLDLFDSIGEIGDAPTRTLKGLSDPIKGPVVQQSVEVILIRTDDVGIAIEDFSQSVNATRGGLERRPEAWVDLLGRIDAETINCGYLSECPIEGIVLSDSLE